jgi:hypothetical protein
MLLVALLCVLGEDYVKRLRLVTRVAHSIAHCGASMAAAHLQTFSNSSILLASTSTLAHFCCGPGGWINHLQRNPTFGNLRIVPFGLNWRAHLTRVSALFHFGWR